MAAQSMSPTSDNDSSARKRVCKACDRCRLKKSKCDGSSPCSRCRTDNAICVFGERKKSHDKVYPKGYVEMLEQQQHQLVTGLQELYELVIGNQGWKGDPLKESTNGHPLTHDILERLGVLKLDSNIETEKFEENLDMLRQKLIIDPASPLQKNLALTNFQNQSPFPETSSLIHYFKDSCPTLNQFPPTPPIQSPDQQAQASIRYMDSQHQVQSEASLDPSMLLSQRQTWLQQQPAIYDENLDYLRFDPPSNYDALNAMQDSTSPCLPMSPWLDDDLSPFELNTNMA